MRKIALISEHASPLAELGSVDAGGQNVYVAQIATELGRRGWHVDVFTRRDDERLPAVLPWRPNVQVIHVPAGPARFVPKEQLLAHMEEFGRYVRRYCRAQVEPYDLMHANFFMSGMVALQIKQALGVPFAITFHALGRVRRQYQGPDDGFDDSRFAIEAALMLEADAIVAECAQDERDMVALYGAEQDKIACVPCGFDPSEFWPVAGARESLGIAADEFVVLQLGRMVARKGVDNVISALALLERAHGVRARLFVVGGNSAEPDPVVTPELGRLMALARQEGVAQRVTFTGSRPREVLRTFYSAADVFVTTPWYEPFGITPLEAMACARPVVGAQVGGLKSTIVHGKTGYLVQPRDPAALAERLAALHRNPALARRMGLAGQRRVASRYTWSSVVDRLAAIYRHTAARSQRAAVPHWRRARLLEGAHPAQSYAADRA
jgi:glycosyltransferase involved in cell wall biosynthesis